MELLYDKRGNGQVLYFVSWPRGDDATTSYKMYMRVQTARKPWCFVMGMR